MYYHLWPRIHHSPTQTTHFVLAPCTSASVVFCIPPLSTLPAPPFSNRCLYIITCVPGLCVPQTGTRRDRPFQARDSDPEYAAYVSLGNLVALSSPAEVVASGVAPLRRVIHLPYSALGLLLMSTFESMLYIGKMIQSGVCILDHRECVISRPRLRGTAHPLHPRPR